MSIPAILGSIYIYSGETLTEPNKPSIFYEGVSPDSVLNLEKRLRASYPNHPIYQIGGDQVRPDEWSDNALFVLPGGRTRLWKWLQNKNVVEQTREFVLRGGKILGVCAGAYACCEEHEYTQEDGSILQGRYGLNFFPGKGIGPLKDARPIPGTRLNARAIQIKWEATRQTGYLTLNGGGYFLPTHTLNLDFEALGRYVDESEGSSIAVIKRRVGQGLVALSFVHPEYQADDYPIEALRNLHAQEPALLEKFENIHAQLEQGRRFQINCFNSLIEELKNHKT